MAYINENLLHFSESRRVTANFHYVKYQTELVRPERLWDEKVSLSAPRYN